MALRTGQHRVVIGHYCAARVVGTELLGIDRTKTRDHAVGRRVVGEILNAATPALGSDGQGTVFDETVGVA